MRSLEDGGCGIAESLQKRFKNFSGKKIRKLLYIFIFSNNQFTKKQTKILHFMMVFPVN